MIMELTHHVVDCPTCGRPVEVQSKHIDRYLACGHCRGRFVAYEADDGELTAAKMDGVDSLKRADQLLQQSGQTVDPSSTDWSVRVGQLLSVPDDDGYRARLSTSPAGDDQGAVEQPIVLLVEHRDEVFARVATDMAKAEMKIIRAKSVTEAMKLCCTYSAELVVANVDLPDQSGWLLAGKMRFVDRGIRIWLYQPQTSMYDEGLASYLQVDELLDYGGDLLGLSESIVDLMANDHEPTCTARKNVEPEELTTA